MSIVVPAGGVGGEYQLLLLRKTSRGRCPFPVQGSGAGTQLLPGLPPPDPPADVEVELDLLKPEGFDVGLGGVPAVPIEFNCVEVPAPNLPPAIPVGLFGVDLMTVCVPQGFGVNLPPSTDLPPARPTGLDAADPDPPPAIPGGLFGVDVPKVAVPEDFTVQLPPVPEC